MPQVDASGARLSAILDRRQARLLIPLGIAVSLSLTGDSTLYAVLPNQIERMGISLAAVGVLLGINRLVRIPANPLAGALGDRLGRRRPLLLGLSLGVLSTWLYGLVHGFWPLFAARLLWGVAWSLINVSGSNMALDWSSVADRGKMSGYYQVSYMAGLAISPFLGGLLTDALGFQPAVRICAALSAIGLAVALAAVPETRLPATRKPQGNEREKRDNWKGVLAALRQMDRQILLAGILFMMVYFVNSGILMSTISLYIGQRWGPSILLAGTAVGVASLAGLMLALRSSLGILAGPAAGAMSDRLGNRWPVARVAIVLAAAGFVTLTIVPALWGVPLGVGLVSLGAPALVAVLIALVGDLAQANRQGVTVGALAAAGDVGSALGPFLAYALAAAVDVRWLYLLCALVLASGLVATVGQPPRR